VEEVTHLIKEEYRNREETQHNNTNIELRNRRLLSLRSLLLKN